MKNRALRRHHEKRLKKKRSRYFNIGTGSPQAIGICYRTPCMCSCWMCGCDRKIFGRPMQEVRALLRYSD
jgi:hypothetical protein